MRNYSSRRENLWILAANFAEKKGSAISAAVWIYGFGSCLYLLFA
jgi:hypothetical protein